MAADVDEAAELAVPRRARATTGSEPAQAVVSCPGSATWSRRAAYCHERAKIDSCSRRSTAWSAYQSYGSVRAPATSPSANLPPPTREGLSLPFWAGMWFGVFPTWEGLLLQAAALAFVVGSYVASEALKRRKRRRILAAPIVAASTAGSAPELPGEMGELRFDQLLPRERNGLGRAGDRDDDRSAVGAGGRA